MPVAAAQPIAGVSSTRESEIESVYPSVASGLLGQVIGMILGAANKLPFTPFRLLVMVALGAALAPLGLLAYVLNKVAGSCYVVTNRSVQERKIIGGRMTNQVALGDIDHIEIGRQSGYEFHRVGDVQLENAQGKALLIVRGIAFPERLQQVILDARNARLRSDESLSRIQSRV